MKDYRCRSVLSKTKRCCEKMADAAIIVRRVHTHTNTRTHARTHERTHARTRARTHTHTCSTHSLKLLLPVAFTISLACC